MLSKLRAPPEQEQPSSGGLHPAFTFSNAAGKFHWEACTRNPGHQPFTPVKEFTKAKLPWRYQKDIVVESILTMSELAVKVDTSYTSQHRPEGDSFYAMRGKRFGRQGSGFVSHVEQGKSRDLDLCSCRECLRGSSKQKLAGSVFVTTATHVVFDDSEVKETTVDLFYDDDVNHDSIIRLYGSKLTRRDPSDDWCEFECQTHDRELLNKLSKTLQRLKDLNKQTDNMEFDPSAPLAVVASHPHGCSKQISIGVLKRFDGSSVSGQERPINMPVKFSEVQCDGESVTITFNFGQASRGLGVPVVRKHPLVQDEETEATGIEVDVLYPDETREKCLIWQLDRPVSETKNWLLQHGAVQDPPAHSLQMVLELPDGDTQAMRDDENINYYWDDICRAVQVYFEVKSGNVESEAELLKTESVHSKKKIDDTGITNAPEMANNTTMV